MLIPVSTVRGCRSNSSLAVTYRAAAAIQKQGGIIGHAVQSIDG